MQGLPDIFDHIIAMVFGVIIPVLSGYRSAKAFKILRLNAGQRRQFFISNSVFLWLVCLVILANWLLHRRSLSDLGLTSFPVLNTATIVLTLLFIVLYTGDILISIRSEAMVGRMKEEWEDTAPFLPVHIKELPVYIFMCITAGLCEEIIFRGFLLQYAVSIAGNNYTGHHLAILAPAIIFALAHYYQGWKAVLKIALLSVIFGYIYIESGSLWIVILLHFSVDLVGGLLSIRYLEEKETPVVNETPGNPEEIPGEFLSFNPSSEDETNGEE